MRIGAMEVKEGEKVFGSVQGPETRGGFPVHIPLHVVCGSSRGPVLVVQAGVSGLEIEPSMVLPHVVDEVDPSQLHGTVIVVPLLNTSGFEFEQKNAVWDDKDLHAVGRGRSDGTVSEQLIDTYFTQVIMPADALIDIRTGARWGYFRYAGVYDVGAAEPSRALAVALGLPQVLLGEPEDRSMSFEAATMGKTVVSAWIGGGPGLRDYREDDMDRVRAAVFNAMRHLGMLAGTPQRGDGPTAVIKAHTVLRQSGRRGLTFIDAARRGTQVAVGEKIGHVMHPFTGDVVEEIRAPRDGVMLHAGAAWPILPEGVILAILGEKVSEHGS